MTGHENLWMQGFPIDITHSMSDFDFTSGNLTELAGNMVSVPVTLALVTSLFASVPWIIDGHSNPAGPARDDSPVQLHEQLVEQETLSPDMELPAEEPCVVVVDMSPDVDDEDPYVLVDMSPDVELHEPLVVEQEDQNPERTRAGTARPEE